MKKFILVIAMLLSGVAANAQMSEDFTSFKLGPYKFTEFGIDTEFKNLPSMDVIENGGGTLLYRPVDLDELGNLLVFLRKNHHAIEEKFNVVIKFIGTCHSGTSIQLLVYNADVYHKYEARKEREERERRREVNSRMSELEDLFK